MRECFMWGGEFTERLRWALAAALLGATAASTNAQARCSATIDLSGGAGLPAITVQFNRSDASARKLLVTALSITDSAAPRRVDRLQFGQLSPYVSHLTGWFVVQQGSRELWVGLALEAGQETGRLTLTTPGLLARKGTFPDQYELLWRAPAPTLPSLAAGTPDVEFATLTGVLFEEPTWGTASPGSGSAWQASSATTYYLDQADVTNGAQSIIITRTQNQVSIWLERKLGLAATAFGVSAVIFSGLFLAGKLPTRRRRRVALFSGLASLGLAGLAARDLSVQAMAFDGAAPLGIVAASAIFLLAPESWMEALSLTAQAPHPKPPSGTD